MNLETIANILVDNSEKFRAKNSLDMSMFLKADIPRIYAAAAEGTLKKRNFDSTGHYLFLGKQWKRLLELGVTFFHSKYKEEQKAGKNFLEILMYNATLPKNVSIELADYILEQEEEESWYRAAKALAAGNATEKAREVAYKFLNEGDFEHGNFFLEVTGKKLTADEVTRFAGFVLERRRYNDALELYKSQSVMLPKDRAKIIANSDLRGWIFDKVVEYMDSTKNSFTAQDFKEFADAIFEVGEYQKALEIYERAGKLISSKGYRTRGEKILAQSREIESGRTVYSPETVWPTLSTAFAYLSKSNPAEAKRIIAQYADALLDQPDFAKISSNVYAFGQIYEMLEIQIPVSKALKAARLVEQTKKYSEAAEFYVAAGMNDAATRMGNLALNSSDDWQKMYGSQNAFKAVGDKDGLAVAQFIQNNLR